LDLNPQHAQRPSVRQVVQSGKKLVQIQLGFTLIAFYNAPENLIAAFRTDIAGLFILNPLFGTHLSPIRNSPQYNLFADRHGKIIDMLTRKFIAWMTSGMTFLSCAVPDLTLSAMHKPLIR
jgi:hypothetical protein